MALATLLALTVLAAAPADQPASNLSHAARTGPHAVAQAVSESAGGEDDGDIPNGAPTDDYGFVAWCYGALGEYLTIYDTVIPDLKAIDKMFGTSVREDEPYTADVAAERLALKRFGAAIGAAERASPTPIGVQGATDIQAGRGIWAAAKQQPHRKLADAWLFWGIPKRCETSAKALKARSNPLAQSLTPGAPSAVEIAMAEPAPVLESPSPPAAPAAPPPPAGPPPRAGAVMVGGR